VAPLLASDPSHSLSSSTPSPAHILFFLFKNFTLQQTLSCIPFFPSPHRDGGADAGGGAGGDQGDYVNLVPVPRNLLYLTQEPEGPRPVTLHKHDRAPSVVLGEDGRTATSAKGYRMVRASHGAYTVSAPLHLSLL
jgi:hypothetical protein